MSAWLVIPLLIAILVGVGLVLRHEYRQRQQPECHYTRELNRCIQKLELEMAKNRPGAGGGLKQRSRKRSLTSVDDHARFPGSPRTGTHTPKEHA